MRARSFLSLVAAFGLMTTPSSAQSTTPDVVRLPKNFLGVAIGPTSNDAASRMRLVNETGSHMWLVEGGVGLSRRLGVGIEYSRPLRYPDRQPSAWI
jgi:hypothetical protein